MNLKQDILGVSNQQKILQLKQKIRSVDSIYPKSPTNSRNVLNFSSSPIQQVVQPQGKQFVRSHNNQHQHLSQLQVQYRQLEENFKNKLEHEYKLLETIDLEIASIQEEVRLNKKDLQRSKEYIEQRATNLEKEASQEVLEQVEQIKSLRKELTQAIDKKYKTIKTETMAALGSHFESGWEEAREELTSKIDDLKASIDQEEAVRDEAVNYMVNSFGDEILKLEQEVQRQREQRQQSHKKILNELQRMEEDVTTLILLQKKEANTGISNLQNFLEELCLKMQSHLLS